MNEPESSVHSSDLLALERSRHHKEQCRTIWHLVSAIADMCAITPEAIVDRLTGYPWDESEAEMIKANTRGEHHE